MIQTVYLNTKQREFLIWLIDGKVLPNAYHNPIVKAIQTGMYDVEHNRTLFNEMRELFLTEYIGRNNSDIN